MVIWQAHVLSCLTHTPPLGGSGMTVSFYIKNLRFRPIKWLVPGDIGSIGLGLVHLTFRSILGLPRPWDSPGKNTGVGCLGFLRGCENMFSFPCGVERTSLERKKGRKNILSSNMWYWFGHLSMWKHICAHTCSVTQSCPALCYLMDCSLPSSTMHGIILARILEWFAISSSRGSLQPWNQTRISWGSCIVRQIFYHWATWEAQKHIC